MNRLPPATSTPKALGYRFPAEWEPHKATWLSWPHRKDSWPERLQNIFGSYCEFVKVISEAEIACINVNDAAMQQEAQHLLEQAGAKMHRVQFFLHPTNDAWCRDHGPAFLVRSKTPKKAIVNWKFNGWGEKLAHDLDDQIPMRIALLHNLPCFTPDIIMEGGSIDVNGAGALLTTTSCLLNRNRNPLLSQEQLEDYLREYYCVDQILWLDDGITGDDTDGHIDDLTRFVNEDTVVTMSCDSSHPDYHALQKNTKALHSMRLLSGKQLNVVELPMPTPYVEDGFFFPCSYANFYICNQAVIVPTFQVPQDDLALDLLSQCFPKKDVIGIHSKDIIWGLGSFHCLSQQEPL